MNDKEKKERIVQERLQKIISLLSADPYLSQDKLALACQVSLRTIKSDISDLKELGYQIHTRTGVFIPPAIPTYATDITVNSSDLAKYIFLARLSEGYSIEHISNEYLCDRSRATIYQCILPYLRENGYVSKKDSGSYMNNRLYFISLPEDNDTLINLALYCLTSKNPYAKSIYETIVQYLDITNDVFTIRTHSALKDLPHICSILDSTADTAFEFLYNGDKKIIYRLSAVFYAHDKNKIYLLGIDKPERKIFNLYRADKIDFDSVCPLKNNSFSQIIQDKKYIDSIRSATEDILAESFCISLEEKEPVAIRVDYSPYTDQELSSLYKTRTASERRSSIRVGSSSCKLYYMDDDGNKYINRHDIRWDKIKYILYEDEIRGISDFENYIRRFGSNVIVLENDKLKKSLKNGAKRYISLSESDELTFTPFPEEDVHNNNTSGSAVFAPSLSHDAINALADITNLLFRHPNRYSIKDVTRITSCSRRTIESILVQLCNDKNIFNVYSNNTLIDSTAIHARLSKDNNISKDLWSVCTRICPVDKNISDAFTALYKAFKSTNHKKNRPYRLIAGFQNKNVLSQNETSNSLSNLKKYISQRKTCRCTDIYNNTFYPLFIYRNRFNAKIYYVSLDLSDNSMPIVNFHQENMIISVDTDSVFTISELAAEDYLKELRMLLRKIWQPYSMPLYEHTTHVRIKVRNDGNGNCIWKMSHDISGYPASFRPLDESASEYLLTADIIGIEGFKPWLLSYGSSVQVYEPTSLRDEITEEYKKIYSYYN